MTILTCATAPTSSFAKARRLPVAGHFAHLRKVGRCKVGKSDFHHFTAASFLLYNKNMNKFGDLKTQVQKHLKKFFLSKSFEVLYNTGIDFYNKGEYEKAIAYFKLAIEKPHPKPQVYYNLALSYQNIKSLELATVAYKKFLELHPNDYDGMYNLGLTYYSLEKYDKATEYFEKCVNLKKDEDGVKALALSYLTLGEEDKAIALADSIIDIPKIGLDLYYTIAKVFENKNMSSKDFTLIEKAIELYAKIIERDPDNFNTYLSTSICYAKKGDWENSVEFCKKAVEKNPKSYEATNQMGFVYYCLNETEKAIESYETAMKLKPEGDSKIYSNLAYAYEKNGDNKKAIKMFNQFISNFPDHPAIHEIKNHVRVLKNT